MTLPQEKIAVPASIAQNAEQKSLHGVEKLSFEEFFEQHPEYPKYIRTQSRLLAKHVRRKRGLCIEPKKQERIIRDAQALELNLPARIMERGFQAVYQDLKDMLAAEGL